MSKLSICFLTLPSEKPTDVIVKKLKENKYITVLKIGKEFIRGSEVFNDIYKGESYCIILTYKPRWRKETIMMI